MKKLTFLKSNLKVLAVELKEFLVYMLMSVNSAIGLIRKLLQINSERENSSTHYLHDI